jgi:D-aminopeptidase
MFIGYHARAGTRNATIDHTYTRLVYKARLKGEPVGELALNAAMAGIYGVPVALVSGDQALSGAVPGSVRTAGRPVEYIGMTITRCSGPGGRCTIWRA